MTPVFRYDVGHKNRNTGSSKSLRALWLASCRPFLDDMQRAGCIRSVHMSLISTELWRENLIPLD